MLVTQQKYCPAAVSSPLSPKQQDMNETAFWCDMRLSLFQSTRMDTQSNASLTWLYAGNEWLSTPKENISELTKKRLIDVTKI